MTSLLTLTSRTDVIATSSFNAKINDGSNKLLSEILDIERSRKIDRFDAKTEMKLNHFTVISVTGAKYDRRIALVLNQTQSTYKLTNTAVRNLFSKLNYNNTLGTIIPNHLHSVVVGQFNSVRKEKFRVSSIIEIKDSLLTLSKVLKADVVIEILNYAISTVDIAKERLQFRFQKVNGNAYIRAILDYKYKNFDNVDLLESLQSFLDKNVSDWRVVRYSSDVLGDNFSIRITKKFTKKATQLGEPVEYALDFSNSETGLSSVAGSVGLYVLKCLNGISGLGSEDSFELIHNRNDGSAFINAVNDLLKQGEITWKVMEEKYNASKSIIINDAETLIKSICKDYTLGKEVSEKILLTFKKDLAVDGISNLFKLSDVFTEVSHKHYFINQDGFHKLQKLGSEILFNHTKFLVASQQNTPSNN